MRTVDSIPFLSTRGNPETISPPAQSIKVYALQLDPQVKLPTVDPPKLDPDPSDLDFPPRKIQKTGVFSMADTETDTGP